MTPPQATGAAPAPTPGKCVARTRKGAPCSFSPAWDAPDNSGRLCTAHASAAGVEGARAEQQARLHGGGAKARPRPRRASGDPIADQVRVLTELREAAQKRRDHSAVVRYSEQLTTLLMPAQRAQAAVAEANGTALAPSGERAVPLPQLLQKLSDAELRCAEVAVKALARAAAAPAAPPAPTLPPAPAQTVLDADAREALIESLLTIRGDVALSADGESLALPAPITPTEET